MNTESGENQAGNNKLIGSQVSLITKADSRYEGTLVEVDRVKKTMTLKNVKTMGTEGRRNGQNEIPATDNIMGQVKFKVELVKVFNIIEQPVEPEEDAKKQEDDPAIIASEEANSDEKL
jgi:protein LSM14